jgi:Zn-dependent protease with chaperone function
MKKSSAAATLLCLLTHLVSAPSSAQTISNKELFEKTQKAAQQAIAYYRSYDDPAEVRRVTEIGYRLAQEAKFQEFPFTFYLVDMPEPNAFALPGGQIFITRGMLHLGLTDDMLAGLLGHEIAHVTREHGLRLRRKATLLNILSQALLAGVIIGASRSDNRGSGGVYDPYGSGSSSGDLIQGTAAAGAVVTELLLRSYSREFEDEADDEGQRLAAAAGFDPDGSFDLMEKMRTHMPQSKEYGYWRTHPFFDERARAAAVREDLLKIQEPSSAADYRARTQAVLLDFVAHSKLDADLMALLKHEALIAWPQGPAADNLRLERLHLFKERQDEQSPLAQDWGAVIVEYRSDLEEVRQLTPESPLVETLEQELKTFATRLHELYPRAVEVFEGGIYERGFLEVFSSNYPDAPEIPEVALALGNAYSRLGRQSDAVTRYLEAWEKAPESPAGQRARAGLRNLAPYLDRLDALEPLAAQTDDVELQLLAETRLDKMAREYKELENGAEYLRKYPDGRHAAEVAARLNSLADKLYGELILYQSVGDHVKGIERIQQILTYAPNSPAAERLRERMVVQT